ncbi:ABC transporter substrate-binding protein [Variovorax sp. YR216]|uniref:ABC transporter substrate-binding protein n=1 Tax=Variovorax sp. YR216 TaxID=1882828 RepID=UPI0008982D18|nr:ABC transporter substrate-binding protein [Variovorax sp. YR216]SEB14550.1 NitT/TauT family transport system substrate-binding protein [Variovorax sp. YR216]
MKPNFFRRTFSGAFAAAVVAAGLLGGATAFAQPESTLVTVNAGFVPVTDVAALYLGEEAGIFRKHGLKLKTNVASTGGVPAVMSGEYHFAFTALVNILQARDKGLPLKIIAAGSSSTGVSGADVTMIHAGPKSGIKSARDLEGKTVSVNALNGLLQMLGKAAVKADGGDPSKVRFIELGFAEALAALQSGKTDAMVGAEPFGTAAIAAGFPPISSPYQSMSSKSMLTSAYFTSEQQLKANPELFLKLRAAINESLEYAQKNPDEVRKQLPKFTKLGPDVAAKLILPTYLTAIPRDAVEMFSKTGREFGMLAKPALYDEVVWTPEK